MRKGIDQFAAVDILILPFDKYIDYGEKFSQVAKADISLSASFI